MLQFRIRGLVDPDASTSNAICVSFLPMISPIVPILRRHSTRPNTISSKIRPL
ncbi:hypothetical protein PLICRDRAFT_41178 [Plicaturopsis crispa FD-325 SS-3]|nr:hypothetical protein PLICRDRAFT_41178 [Plicaturopsis crispa FD-325 SS-3]